MHLTTSHPTSSYGQPVLIHEGQAYGPADLIDGTPAGELAFQAARAGEIDKDLAGAFLRSWPRSTSEAAALVGVTAATILNHCRKGSLKHARAGGQIYILASDLLAYEPGKPGRPK